MKSTLVIMTTFVILSQLCHVSRSQSGKECFKSYRFQTKLTTRYNLIVLFHTW